MRSLCWDCPRPTSSNEATGESEDVGRQDLGGAMAQAKKVLDFAGEVLSR